MIISESGLLASDSAGRRVGQTGAGVSYQQSGLLRVDAAGRIVSGMRAGMANGDKGILCVDGAGRLVASTFYKYMPGDAALCKVSYNGTTGQTAYDYQRLKGDFVAGMSKQQKDSYVPAGSAFYYRYSPTDFLYQDDNYEYWSSGIVSRHTGKFCVHKNAAGTQFVINDLSVNFNGHPFFAVSDMVNTNGYLGARAVSTSIDGVNWTSYSIPAYRISLSDYYPGMPILWDGHNYIGVLARMSQIHDSVYQFWVWTSPDLVTWTIRNPHLDILNTAGTAGASGIAGAYVDGGRVMVALYKAYSTTYSFRWVYSDDSFATSAQLSSDAGIAFPGVWRGKPYRNGGTILTESVNGLTRILGAFDAGSTAGSFLDWNADTSLNADFSALRLSYSADDPTHTARMLCAANILSPSWVDSYQIDGVYWHDGSGIPGDYMKYYTLLQSMNPPLPSAAIQ